jgi:hypothetical protein
MPTTETFWNQMGLYNEATFSVQIIMLIKNWKAIGKDYKGEH